MHEGMTRSIKRSMGSCNPFHLPSKLKELGLKVLERNGLTAE